MFKTNVQFMFFKQLLTWSSIIDLTPKWSSRYPFKHSLIVQLLFFWICLRRPSEKLFEWSCDVFDRPGVTFRVFCEPRFCLHLSISSSFRFSIPCNTFFAFCKFSCARSRRDCFTLSSFSARKSGKLPPSSLRSSIKQSAVTQTLTQSLFHKNCPFLIKFQGIQGEVGESSPLQMIR